MFNLGRVYAAEWPDVILNFTSGRLYSARFRPGPPLRRRERTTPRAPVLRYMESTHGTANIPAPWRIVQQQAAILVVRDAHGFALAVATEFRKQPLLEGGILAVLPEAKA